MARSIPSLSTPLASLSTPFRDNFSVLSSTFTPYPQKRATPITTIFIYRYLSPQANLWGSSKKIGHSINCALYAKLSNLEGVYSQTNGTRASA
jgi:hypothetical protein